jgi:hypothetical protein
MKELFFINHNIAFKKPKATSELWHYTAGNIGNAYIGYASIKMLTGRFGRVDGIPNLWSFDENAIDVNFINRSYSKVILCMQDQIRVDESYYRPDYTRICNFLEKIQLPFVVLSLGANAIQAEYDTELHLKIPKEKIRFLSLIASKSLEIGVRGYYSAEVLNKLGIFNVNPVGCHTFFLNKNKKIIKKNVSLIKNVITNGGLLPNNIVNEGLQFSYVLQCQNEDPSLFAQEIELRSKLLNFKSLYCIRHLDFFRKKAIYLPTTIDEWVKIINKYDFSIGRRVHGTILALNNNIPALLASGDLRSREMSEIFSIPRDYTLDHTVDIRAIYDQSDFTDLNKKFPLLYQRFLEFSKKNDVHIH